MRDPYFFDDVDVLKNKLNLKDEKALDLVESELSRSRMMLLYEEGFVDFPPDVLCLKSLPLLYTFIQFLSWRLDINYKINFPNYYQITFPTFYDVGLSSW